MGWPIGDTAAAVAAEDNPSTVLAEVSPVEVRGWWRIAVACELVGAMRAALDLTVAHVSERQQFGRPIGSFQAVQHGLAECAVAVEGARWLTYEAAWAGTPAAAATALAAAVTAAARVGRDAHQYSGALGFTTEYDLHLSTMRLVALTIEAGTIGSPVVAAASGRWPPLERSPPSGIDVSPGVGVPDVDQMPSQGAWRAAPARSCPRAGWGARRDLSR